MIYAFFFFAGVLLGIALTLGAFGLAEWRNNAPRRHVLGQQKSRFRFDGKLNTFRKNKRETKGKR